MAITIEKNISKARTWFVRGNVYAAIAKGYLDIDSLSIEKSHLIKILHSSSLARGLTLFNKYSF